MRGKNGNGKTEKPDGASAERRPGVVLMAHAATLTPEMQGEIARYAKAVRRGGEAR